MAIYHLSIKTISRSKGQSATAAASYRAGDIITDRTTGVTNDYRKKGGVEHSEIVGSDLSRSELWNRAEEAETRKNSTVAREFEIALPSELSPEARRQFAIDFAKEIVAKHKVVADVAIHSPGKGGDNRNYHAHILLTTRRWDGEKLTEKSRELDDQKSGETEYWRERWATFNKERGIDIDHRTLAEQGIERIAEPHYGKNATHFERRTGEKSDIRQRTEEFLAIDVAKNEALLDKALKVVTAQVGKFEKGRKLTAEAIKASQNLQISDMLELIGAHAKTYKEGNNQFTQIAYNGNEFRVAIDEKSQKWNDQQTARKEGEPRRIGAVSLLMHIGELGFRQAYDHIKDLWKEREALQTAERNRNATKQENKVNTNLEMER